MSAEAYENTLYMVAPPIDAHHVNPDNGQCCELEGSDMTGSPSGRLGLFSISSMMSLLLAALLALQCLSPAVAQGSQLASCTVDYAWVRPVDGTNAVHYVDTHSDIQQ